MGRKPVPIKTIRGARLKMLMEEQELTQTRLSKITGIDQRLISKIINGKANLTEENARWITEKFPGSAITFEKLMGYDQEPMLFDSPLEFEKNWIRGGGGAHPIKSIIVAEARISVALESLNEKGWQLAVSLVEALCGTPDLAAQKEENNK